MVLSIYEKFIEIKLVVALELFLNWQNIVRLVDSAKRIGNAGGLRIVLVSSEGHNANGSTNIVKNLVVWGYWTWTTKHR